MNQRIDAKAVLTYLNELGFTQISAPQLKEFIVDLKKLMKYEDVASARTESVYSDQRPSTAPESPKPPSINLEPKRFSATGYNDFNDYTPYTAPMQTQTWSPQQYVSPNYYGQQVQMYMAKSAPSAKKDEPPKSVAPIDAQSAKSAKESITTETSGGSAKKQEKSTAPQRTQKESSEGTDTSTDRSSTSGGKKSKRKKKRRQRSRSGKGTKQPKGGSPGKSALSKKGEKEGEKDDKKVQIKGRKSASPSPPGTPKKRISGPKRGKLSRLCECNIDDPALMCPHGFPWPTEATKEPPIGCYCCDKKTQTGPPGAIKEIKKEEETEEMAPPKVCRPKKPKKEMRSSVIVCKHSLSYRRPKTDPIALYNYYKNAWKTEKIPGENFVQEAAIRWWTREKMACGPPVDARSYAIALMGVQRCKTCR